MCVAFFVYQHVPNLKLLLAFNRDEQFDRPTQPAHFWPDHPHILGGRDAVGGGTWLGISKHGRFAFLTNYREAPLISWPTTRGQLTLDFLRGDQAPEEYLKGIRGEDYAGFNLVVGDLAAEGDGQLWYLTNRGPDGLRGVPTRLQPGVYGLTNGVLWQPWAKAARGKELVEGLVREGAFGGGAAGGQGTEAAAAGGVSGKSGGTGGGGGSGGGGGGGEAAAAGGGGGGEDGVVPWQRLFDVVLCDRQGVEEHERHLLPATGYPPEFEAAASSIFMPPFAMPSGGTFGTRSQTVLVVQTYSAGAVGEDGAGKGASFAGTGCGGGMGQEWGWVQQEGEEGEEEGESHQQQQRQQQECSGSGQQQQQQQGRRSSGRHQQHQHQEPSSSSRRDSISLVVGKVTLRERYIGPDGSWVWDRSEFEMHSWREPFEGTGQEEGKKDGDGDDAGSHQKQQGEGQRQKLCRQKLVGCKS